MIRFERVTKIYPPDSAALDGVSFEIQKGEFVSLVGKSGAGKSTIIKMLLREEGPTAGRVLFEDQDIMKIPDRELSLFRRKVGVVFQDFKLLQGKTAYENVSFVMEVMGATDEQIARDVREVLEIVGLVDRARHFPVQLSGGERQRVAIARALIHRPQVLIADEPTGNLDPYHTRDIIKLLGKVRDMGTTVLLATHDKEVINYLGHRVITLEAGRIIRDEAHGKFVI